jgi:hypothetical protein
LEHASSPFQDGRLELLGIELDSMTTSPGFRKRSVKSMSSYSGRPVYKARLALLLSGLTRILSWFQYVAVIDLWVLLFHICQAAKVKSARSRRFRL